jgi:UDP-N-acetylmuramoylalanine--D-glutamate ligase
MLSAEGLRSRAVGNVGTPVLQAVMDPEPAEVLAVELSSYQLYWSSSLAAESAAVLNVAPDHIDWHGSTEAYAAAKGRIYQNVQRACVYNVQDPWTERLVREADVVEGARAIGFTLGLPEPGMLGIVDDVLADRASSTTGRATRPSWARCPTCTTRHPMWSPMPLRLRPWPGRTGSAQRRCAPP